VGGASRSASLPSAVSAGCVSMRRWGRGADPLLPFLRSFCFCGTEARTQGLLFEPLRQL
jgi:hypothetical protein